MRLEYEQALMVVHPGRIRPWEVDLLTVGQLVRCCRMVDYINEGGHGGG